MNKYIKEFSKYLGQLGNTERDEVIVFYQEYLEDGGFETYDQVVSELGSPKQLARKVLADHSIRLLSGTVNKNNNHIQKSVIRTIWIIILAILSTPITIPISIAVLIFMFAVILLSGVVILATGFIVVSILIAAIVAIFFGMSLIGTNVWVAMTYIGGGVAAIGVFWLLIIPTASWITQRVVRGTLSISKWLYFKLNRNNKVEGRHN